MPAVANQKKIIRRERKKIGHRKLEFTSKTKADQRTVELYNGEVIITYKHGRHTYTVFDQRNGVTGVMVPSVTQILRCLDKPALIGWVANCARDFILNNFKPGKVYRFTAHELEAFAEEAKNAHRAVSQTACDIGSLAHDWLAQYIVGVNNGNKTQPVMPKNESAKRCCIAGKKWLETVDLKPMSVEEIVYSRRFGYLGTMDVAGGLVKIKDQPYIIDWKSSRGLYSEYRFQLAAYRNCFEEMYGLKGLGRMVVKLGKDDGSFEPFDLPEDEYAKDLETFLSLIPVQKRLRELSVRP